MREFKGYYRGVNLGGWLSQCGRNYNKEHYDTFIREKDFEIIRSWGLDHVRVPVDAEVIQEENGALKEDGLAYLDSCMEWCQKYGLKQFISKVSPKWKQKNLLEEEIEVQRVSTLKDIELCDDIGLALDSM